MCLDTCVFHVYPVRRQIIAPSCLDSNGYTCWHRRTPAHIHTTLRTHTYARHKQTAALWGHGARAANDRCKVCCCYRQSSLCSSFCVPTTNTDAPSSPPFPLLLPHISCLCPPISLSCLSLFCHCVSPLYPLSLPPFSLRSRPLNSVHFSPCVSDVGQEKGNSAKLSLTGGEQGLRLQRDNFIARCQGRRRTHRQK